MMTKISPMTLCEYCGKEKYNKGFPAHQRACARRHHNVKLTSRRKAAAFQERTVQKTEEDYTARDVGPPQGEIMRLMYSRLKHDAAIFTAVTHLLAVKPGEADELSNLLAARDMIELRIEESQGD